MTEDEMVGITRGWHHQLDEHEFEQALGVGDGQGSLVCCSPWGHSVGHDLATDQKKTKKFHIKLHLHRTNKF